MTTIKVDTRVRDLIARIAAEDYEGATLGETLHRLVEEHEEQQVLAAYERLRRDPEEWASYIGEFEEFERAALHDLQKRLGDE